MLQRHCQVVKAKVSWRGRMSLYGRPWAPGENVMEHEDVTTALQAPARTTTTISTPQEKKPGIITLVRNLTSNTSFSIPASARSGAQPTWEPTFLRPLPLIGIGALLASVCCLFASLGILIASDGQATEKWHPWSPSVFLAISSAFVNRATQFALVQAIPIAWWYKAYNGATLRFFRAMKNARHEWGMAIAMTFCTLVVIDGPFLQKSSSVVAKQQTRPVKLNFPITPEMPSGFSGVYDHIGIATSDEAAPAISSYTYNSSIVANITGCSERATCRTQVRGPGLVIQNCSSETWPLDRNTLLHNRTATWGPGGEKRVAPMPLFNTQFEETSVRKNNFTGPEELELRVGIANYTNCSGSYVQKYCSLISAILEYDVMVTSTNVVSFASPANTAKLISLANNTFINSSITSDIPLTFSALGAFMDGQISANVTMKPSSRPGQELLISASESFNNFATRYSTGEALCEGGFTDPTDDILADMNNLMFRAGILAAQKSNSSSRIDPGLTINQTLTATETLTLNVFHTDLRWFAGAAIFEILAILTIFPIFWGWWKLGVKHTMSPLEILKAGEAPLLKEANSGAGSRGVVEVMGDLRVRFGVREDVTGVVDGEGRVKREEVRRRLVLGESESVGRPGRGEGFDE
ncbi:hypothetical protein HII31_05444 [Pseudocercospora fuligena]|uniref:Uncharacterized protein n=1 Tax=Pseudocercospora fuligena TaxID=685502 RepID=A0A8H6RLC3_9PEZI|nr:hypothetical protein HII31_05444 [Pseudocercospora fuligena]